MRRKLLASVVAILVAAGLAVTLGPSGAGASTSSSFYAVPSPLPAGQPGDVIKHEKMTAYTLPLVPMLGATATRIMYRSTDRIGRPVAITGTVLVPTTPWKGPGQRPLIAFAFGTHGQADQCASSRQLAAGTDYEASFVQLLLLQGYAIAATDYLGVGTTNYLATYINRLDQAHAVLDAARAAQRLSLSGIPAHGPVAIWGYSQGGEGSGSALELAPTYAPDLHVFAGFAGAIPADMVLVAKANNRGVTAGLMGYFMNMLNDAYPGNDLTSELTPAGLNFMKVSAANCIIQLTPMTAFTNSASFFKDGRTLDQHLTDAEWKAAMGSLLLGSGSQAAPKVPVFVMGSTADEIVPIASSRGVAARWCARGANVDFATTVIPEHIVAVLPTSLAAIGWLRDRVEGKPAVSNCGHF